MSKSSPRASARERLLVSLDEIIRKVGAQAVLISDLVATRVGLNPTDLECLDLLHLAGPTTAGQVSARSGLTSGATTAVIDRLERAGFVKRSRDPEDRRVVRVEVLEHCGPHIEPLYRPLQEGLGRVNARYTNHELDVVVRYFTEAFEAGATHVAWLQTQPALSHRRLRLHAGGNESFGHATPAARPGAPVRRPHLRQRRQEPARVAARRK
jgi:DNA-binding MarR family transcriptional regulator